MRIKSLPKIERPREKLIRYGPEKLTNSELLAIILGSGVKGKNVVELARTVFNAFPHDRLVSATFFSLREDAKLGTAKSCQVIACLELGKRLLKNKETTLLLKPQDVWQELKDIRTNKKEYFVVFYLDTRNGLIKKEIISVGTLNASVVHPREVFELAVKYSAAQILVAHNHPSGDPVASNDDIAVTKRLVAAGQILDIELIDHVIVTKERYLSLKEHKMM